MNKELLIWRCYSDLGRRSTRILLSFRKTRFLFENQAHFHAPSLMDFPDLPGPSLCPVKVLKEYLTNSDGPS